MSEKYQEYKASLQVENTVDDVNNITKKEKNGTSDSHKKETDKSGKNAGTLKTKATKDETAKVNSINKTNTKENYQNFKDSLVEEKDRLTKSKEIIDAIIAQTDDEEIIKMGKGIQADIAKGQLTPKQSEWIYNTSTSFKK